MHCLYWVIGALVVGAGCGYGFRGWIGHKRDALVKEAQSALSIGKPR